MASYLKNKDFLNIVVGQLSYHASHTFGWAFLPIYILLNGFQLIDLVWFYLVVFVTIGVSLLWVKTEETRWVLVKGLLLRVLMLVLLFKLLWQWQLWLIAVFYGLFWGIFWVTLNIRYYETANFGGTAFASAIMNSIGPVTAAAIPILTGLIAGTVGAGFSFAISLLLLVGTYLSFRRLPKKKVKYDVAQSTVVLKNLRTLLFLDGYWQISHYILIPIITIDYISSLVGYGAFQSYVGVAGVFASFVLSKLADRSKDKSKFVYPAAIFMGAFTLLSAFTGNLWSWTIMVGLFTFFRSMAIPFMTTAVLDSKGDLVDKMLGREIFTNIGRIAGTVITLLFFYLLSDYRVALITTGFAGLLYPFVLYSSGVYARADRRMQFSAPDRFKVLVRVWLLSPFALFPKRLLRRWRSLREFGKHPHLNKILKKN